METLLTATIKGTVKMKQSMEYTYKTHKKCFQYDNQTGPSIGQQTSHQDLRPPQDSQVLTNNQHCFDFNVD